MCSPTSIQTFLAVAAALTLISVRAERTSNSFFTIEGEGVRIASDGSISVDADATGPVTLTARSGWLVNGRESVTYPSPRGLSSGLILTSKLGEDHSCFPPPPTEKREHITNFVFEVESNPTNLIAMYALPATSVAMTVTAHDVLLEAGRHKVTKIWEAWKCSVCDAKQEARTNVSERATAPDAWTWSATAAGRTFPTNTWSGPMSKGLGQKIEFTVTGRWSQCSQCKYTTNAVVRADIHELSVERPDYLGLDRTDAGLSGRAVTNATAHIDPAPASATYNWTKCGKCQFVGATDWRKATYGITNSATASTKFHAEDLKVTATAKNADGLSASATCTTNFTVVAVDVTLKDWGEQMDEKNDTIIGSYVKRNGSGLFGEYPELAADAMTRCPVRIKVSPGNLPDVESASLVFPNGNLIVNDDPEVAESSYGVDEINSQLFYLFDESGSLGKKTVEARHDASSAKDIIGYDVCCCTVTIYSDASELFVDGKWNAVAILGNVVNTPGHSFCMINIDAEHEHLVPIYLQKYIGIPHGFYPDGDSEEYYDVPSDFCEEKRHFANVVANMTGTASHVWHISLEGCIKGLERMYELETVRPNYDLMCFNCTDAAISIGRSCGASVPSGGLPDLSAFESIRGGLNGDLDWAQSILNKDSDGSYSSPLVLMWKLNMVNKMYGERE